ncbi:hypothetical protein OH805_35165 [Streptomyces sp. NBC_00879]|uniref:hypothetical protein n=1 Tax=Streptomyces sp. NBC_00879 TaxID=2975855 RepID=UPI00387039DB|nr:hypothetical protein OH805_35165 [Streptomyces sp. NBC_00879]
MPDRLTEMLDHFDATRLTDILQNVVKTSLPSGHHPCTDLFNLVWLGTLQLGGGAVEPFQEHPGLSPFRTAEDSGHTLAKALPRVRASSRSHGSPGR